GQRGHQVAIKLDHRHLAMALEQRERDGTLSRADLHQVVAGLGIDRLDDLVDDGAVVQEVLPEVLLGGLGEGVRSHRDMAPVRAVAIAEQVRTAANRLEGSAVPLPAISSAVPWSTATRG